MTEQDVILLIGVAMIAAIAIGGILLWPSWRDAHIEQARLLAEILRPPTAKPADPSCKHDWCGVFPTPDADFDPSRWFEICTKCHTIRNGN